MEETSLQKAFVRFSEETSRLQNSYRELQQEFKELNLKLQESNRTLERILQHISEGIIFVTIDGRITHFNTAAGIITGYNQTQVLGGYYWDYFSDTLFGFSMSEALKKGIEKSIALLTLKYNNLEKELEVSTTWIHNQGIFLLLQDKTEQRRLDETLHRNSHLRDLGEMAASLAHEIRNPLGGIEGFACLLLNDLKDLPHQQKMVEAVLEGSRTINRLVTNVLNYARPLHVHFVPTDLHFLIEETLQLAAATPHFEKKKTSYANKSRSPLVAALDKELFKMAFMNILQNAFYASPKNKSVTINLFEEMDVFCISIRDEGGGISEENLKKIFLPFFTTKPSGTGLGLSEAHKVIQAHGGVIEVDSQPRQGTTFIIKVPKYNAH